MFIKNGLDGEMVEVKELTGSDTLVVGAEMEYLQQVFDLAYIIVCENTNRLALIINGEQQILSEPIRFVTDLMMFTQGIRCFRGDKEDDE